MSPTDKLPFPPARAPDAPSDLTLDRYLAGELDAEERAAVDAAVARSPEVAGRLETLRGGFPDPGLEARLWARVEAGLDEETLAPEARALAGVPRPPWWRRLLAGPRLAAALGAVAAVTLAVVVPWPTASAPDGPSLRLKGGVGLTVHRQVADGSEVVLSGATLPAGTTLRFTVDVPVAGQLMVVDVDARGVVAVAHPQDGSQASVAIASGRDQALGSAIALDDAPGDEYLHAVLCEAPFSARDVAPGHAPGELTLPAGCTSAPFLFRKAP